MRVNFVKQLFLVISLLGLVITLVRPDYNFVLFGFLWAVFDKIPPDRRWRHYRYILAFIVLSILQDLLYVLYWTPRWFSSDWQRYQSGLYKLSAWAVGLMCIVLAIKTVAMLILFYPEHGLCCWSPKKEDDIFEEYEVVKYHRLPPATH